GVGAHFASPCGDRAGPRAAREHRGAESKPAATARSMIHGRSADHKSRRSSIRSESRIDMVATPERVWHAIRGARRLIIAVDPSHCARAAAPSRRRCGRISVSSPLLWSSSCTNLGKKLNYLIENPGILFRDFVDAVLRRGEPKTPSSAAN